ncbi:MAG TPA: hypothetical protein VGJ20_31550 [Xanthobacteraceae bacterium]|jgi:hypothetical protein
MIVMQASASAQSLDVYRGVNETHLHWKTPEQREKIIDDMRQAGVGSVRVDLGAPFDKSIDSLDLLTRKGLSILLIVGFSEPYLVARDAKRRPGRGPIWSVAPLSQLDLEFFREKFGDLWREIERRRIRLAAIEAGNEINWAAFNGDLGLLSPHGQPPQGAPGSVALHDRAAYVLGLRRYVAAVAIIKQFRDASVSNNDAKIISAGLASMPASFAANVGAEYVDPNETLDILKADGLDAVVDGYGVHFYPNVNQTPSQRTRDFEDLLRPCTAGADGHPCWLTEWGVRQPNLACPSDESKRVPLIRETLERIAANARQKRISGSYYYDWDDQPAEYAVWRCGGLTAGGKVLFGR